MARAAFAFFEAGAKIAAGLLLLGAVAGCTSVSPFRGVTLGGRDLYVAGLPPLRQNAQYACGPVCLAAVCAHWGVPVEKFLEKCPVAPRDTTGPELRTLAESLGLQAFVFQGSMDDIRDNLGRGRPMIVMISKPPDPSLRQVGFLGGFALAISERVPHPPHWVVVAGLTDNDEVIVYDPAAGPLQIKRAVFQRWWQRQGNLCVLVASR